MQFLKLIKSYCKSPRTIIILWPNAVLKIKNNIWFIYLSLPGIQFTSLAFCIASSMLLTYHATAIIIGIVITQVKLKCERDVSPDTFKKYLGFWTDSIIHSLAVHIWLIEPATNIGMIWSNIWKFLIFLIALSTRILSATHCCVYRTSLATGSWSCMCKFGGIWT